MAYHGARAAGASTNPLSIAVPGGRNGPIVLDMATGIVALGKLVQARKNKTPIPPGWALDKQGLPTTDPAAAHIPLPMSGAKGSGLSLMIVMISLNLGAGNLQFADRSSFLILGAVLLALAMLITLAVEKSRLGAQLVAVRENEAAAAALGVDILAVKLRAISLSAALTGAAGALYAQYFLYIYSNIAFGTWISVEALLAPIIGGAGTVFGPLIGALILQGLSEGTKMLIGRIPGVDLIIFGVLLILVVRFPLHRIPGLLAARWRGKGAP
jgi:branched-chain amino acid transport system permease protein